MGLSKEHDEKIVAWDKLRFSPTGPKPGQVYEHYKGGVYSIIAVAIREDTLVPVVIYQSNFYGTVMERTLDNFTGSVQVGDEVKARFYRVTR